MKNKSNWRVCFAIVLTTCITLTLYQSARVAVVDAAELFGWLIGAATSPIAATVAPLIFGLLASSVLVTVWKLADSARAFFSTDRKANWTSLAAQCIGALIVLNLTNVFVFHTRAGIYIGQDVRRRYDKEFPQDDAQDYRVRLTLEGADNNHLPILDPKGDEGARSSGG